MDAAENLILYVLVFVGVLLAFEGLVQVLFGSEKEAHDKAVNKRLRMLASGTDPEEVLRLLRRRRRQSGIDSIPLLRSWPALVIQCGLAYDPMRLLYAMVGLTLGLGFLLTLVGFSFFMTVALSALVGLALPLLLLMTKRSRRLGEMERQLPDGIDLMVRSLRAGYPLNAAFQVISRETPDPLGTEMGIISDEITYGDDLTDAVSAFAERVGFEDARYLAVAINIQAGTGGNLASVLEALARVIRERFAMRRKIKALSAEGRITAYIVSAIPVIIYFGLNLVSPSYYGEVKGDPLHMPFLVAGTTLTVVNALILRKLVRFHF